MKIARFVRVGSILLLSSLVVFRVCAARADADPPRVPALVWLSGAEFEGGGAKQAGDFFYEKPNVNMVYAIASGAPATLQAVFPLDAIPEEPLFLHLLARDDNTGSRTRIRIALNDTPLFLGRTEFPSDAWEWRAYPIPARAVRPGENRLVVGNLEEEGRFGSPPWFMIADCAVGVRDIRLRRPVEMHKDFHIVLPTEKRPFPEPLAEGEDPGFPIRGTKGWAWTAEQYLEEIPWLAKSKMNFLMNCYLSMFDIETYSFGDPEANRWWEPLPEAKRAAYEKVVRECRKHGIEFCFGMNPNLGSERILDYDKPGDLEALWAHYAWMQSLGVRWFNISLDDIQAGIDASGQARVVNDIYARLLANDPEVRMIFCPTHYWGTGENDPYLETLARELHPDIYCFWTGKGVRGPIRTEDAAAFKRAIGHRLFVWDNYPVNNAGPLLNLGPVADRDPDLPTVADGYMGNSMCQQNQMNRLPMFTCADYAYNPGAYDPARSVAQAILHLADTEAQRLALRDLVELYPGHLIVRDPRNGADNAVRTRYARTVNDTPHPVTVARGFVAHVADVLERLDREFPELYAATRETLREDLAFIRREFRERYDCEP